MKLSPRYREALAFAYEHHRHQEAEGSGIPYLSHSLAVSALALEHGADEDQAIAALLHASVEEPGGGAALGEIEARFGARVAGLVHACADAPEAAITPWKDVKDRFLARLAAFPAEAMLVTACDKLHDLRALVSDYREEGEALWRRFGGGREGTLWYYRELAKVIAPATTVGADLRRALDELHNLAG